MRSRGSQQLDANKQAGLAVLTPLFTLKLIQVQAVQPSPRPCAQFD